MSTFSLFQDLVRHAAAILLILFLGFLCAYILLRARERRVIPSAWWTGPLSLAWAVTLGLAGLLILVAFFCVVVPRPHMHTLPTWDADLSTATGVLQTFTWLTPVFAGAAWIGLSREARKTSPAPGRHSVTALAGLLMSGAALLAFAFLFRQDL